LSDALRQKVRERRLSSEREGSTYFYFGSVLWRATDYGWLDRRLLPRGNPHVVLGLSE